MNAKATCTYVLYILVKPIFSALMRGLLLFVCCCWFVVVVVQFPLKGEIPSGYGQLPVSIRLSHLFPVPRGLHVNLE